LLYIYSCYCEYLKCRFTVAWCYWLRRMYYSYIYLAIRTGFRVSFMKTLYVFSVECFSYCFMCLVTSFVRMPESFVTTAYGWNLFPNESCFEQYCSLVVWKCSLLIICFFFNKLNPKSRSCCIFFFIITEHRNRLGPYINMHWFESYSCGTIYATFSHWLEFEWIACKIWTLVELIC
jgi:hypothetical protein